eukprot:s2579_g4.t1
MHICDLHSAHVGGCWTTQFSSSSRGQGISDPLDEQSLALVRMDKISKTAGCTLLHAASCRMGSRAAQPADSLAHAMSIGTDEEETCTFCFFEDKKREISCHQVARPLDPPPDPKAKAGKAQAQQIATQ